MLRGTDTLGKLLNTYYVLDPVVNVFLYYCHQIQNVKQAQRSFAQCDTTSQ